MIRPITLICFAAACGSGLYLYQEKHRVQVLDQQIEHTVHAAEKAREQTRMLRAEWTLLNDPDRLRQLATQFLPTLQSLSPSQYTDMADLDSRLPAVPPPPPPAPPATAPEAEPGSGVPVAQAEPDSPIRQAEAAQPAESTRAEAASQAGVSGPPAASTQQVAVVPPRNRPAPSHPAPVHPVVALARPTETHSREVRLEPRPVEPDHRLRDAHFAPHRNDNYRPDPHPYIPRRDLVAAAPPPRFVRPAPPPAYSGSLLGMAGQSRGVPAPVPLPRPMPVNAYGGFGGGGGG